MHPEIEQLIDYALADGVISEKERNVIYKKAKELGINQDEVEIYLDSKLFSSNKESNKNKFKGLKICPECGNKVSGLENICQCGHVFNAVFEGEARSLESVINSLDNLIVEVKSFNLGDYKKVNNASYLNELEAKIDKELRYVKTRFGDEKNVKKLIIELETLSNTQIKKLKAKRGALKFVYVFIFFSFLALVVFRVYKNVTFKTPKQQFEIAILDKYGDLYKVYKSSKYKEDSIKFYKYWTLEDFNNQGWRSDFRDKTSDSIVENYYKNSMNFDSPSEFYFWKSSVEASSNDNKIEARKIIDTALVLFPNFSRFYYRLSNITDSKDSAVYYIKLAIEKTSKYENQEIYNLLNYRRALGYFEGLNRNYNKSLEIFYDFKNECKKRGFPVDKNIILQMTLLYYDNGNPKMAKSLFNAELTIEEQLYVKKTYPDNYEMIINSK